MNKIDITQVRINKQQKYAMKKYIEQKKRIKKENKKIYTKSLSRKK